MKAIDLIRWAMQFTEEGTVRLIDDIRNNPLVTPNARGGNHPLWNMGHLAYIEGSLHHIVTGEPNPVEKWAPLFATGTQPQTQASAYPPFEEIIPWGKEYPTEQTFTVLGLTAITGRDRLRLEIKENLKFYDDERRQLNPYKIFELILEDCLGAFFCLRAQEVQPLAKT